MKNIQAQKGKAKNTAEKKQEVKVFSIKVIDVKLLPKFGVLMQTEY